MMFRALDFHMLMLMLAFLHAGGLAAPMHHRLGADPELQGGENDTLPATDDDLPSTAEGGDDSGNFTFVKESLVHIQVTPPETLDLVDFAAIHRSTASIQSFLESGSDMFDSMVRFFRETVFPPPPPTRQRPRGVVGQEYL